MAREKQLATSRILAAAFFGMTLSFTATAGVQNDIPSCYAANDIGIKAPAPEQEVFILIDQTTPLDDNLRNSVRENVGRFMRPGVSFVIASFSAFSQGHYMEVTSAGRLEPQIPENKRGGIGVKVLKTFDTCLKDQATYAVKLAGTALNKALEGSSSSLAKSDVLASIKDLSARVKQSEAKDKVVFIVSDMLENSSVSSFYASKNVRAINPAKELKAAEDAKLIGDFGGARVFVLGAGIVQEDGAKSHAGVYRDPKTIAALKDFWQQLFAKSNGELTAFGTPALMVPVR